MKKALQKILLPACLALLATPYAVADVDLNATNFPDENFRTLLAKYDKDKNSVLSDTEIASIKSLFCRVPHPRELATSPV